MGDPGSTVLGVLIRPKRARRGLLRHGARFLPPSRGRGDRWWVDPGGRVAISDALAFATRSDGLVLSAAGEEQTMAQLAKLASDLAGGNWDVLAGVRGAFALAVWNGSVGRLTLARDRLGQRALYVHEDDDALWFSSELDAILLSYHPKLDLASAASYLTRGHALCGRTLAQEVIAVPAAHYVSYSEGSATVARYWTPLRPTPSIRRRARVAAVRARLKTAVKRASVCRQGLLLSGGVDSSLIACLAVRYAAPPVGFTLATGENGDDVAYASLVARTLGLRHVVVDLGAADAAEILPRVLDAAVPMSAWTAIGHVQLLAAMARTGLSNALSGLGADELFGGYDRFVDYFYRQRSYARRSPPGTDWFRRLLHDPVRNQTDLFPGIATFFDADACASMLSEAARRFTPPSDIAFYEECRRISPDANVLAMMGAHEAQHRIPDLLLQTFEPLARAAGIELAYPFLDRDVANTAMAFGADDHFWFERGAWWAKRTLRASARGIVPAPIVMRRRTAYDVPILAWLRTGRFAAQVIERVATTTLWKAGLLRRTVRGCMLRDARALSRGELDQPEAPCNRIWALLTLGAWYDRYVDGR